MPALPTETPSAAHPQLDRYDSAALVAALVDDQQGALAAVREAAPALARAVDAAWPRLQAGGRLLYAGAGTSGRLGVLDSVELPPTFSWPPQRALALLAGGPSAMFAAVEGAEDDSAQGSADMQQLVPNAQDVAILIAASGTTPYALGALAAARAAGALTIALANNPGTPLLAQADIAVLLDTGAEVICGSTRLKAGTAQKMALNALSSALMVKLHKVYGNLMVDVRASNAKLRQRAMALTMQASGCDAQAAAAALAQCEQRVKPAILMLRAGVDVAEADRRLAAAAGDLHQALQGR